MFCVLLLSPHNIQVFYGLEQPLTAEQQRLDLLISELTTQKWITAQLVGKRHNSENTVHRFGERASTWADLTPAMMKALRVRNPLVRECMAEILGTFVLLVSEPVWIHRHDQGAWFWITLFGFFWRSRCISLITLRTGSLFKSFYSASLQHSFPSASSENNNSVYCLWDTVFQLQEIKYKLISVGSFH